jgi:hypothetical protein
VNADSGMSGCYARADGGMKAPSAPSFSVHDVRVLLTRGRVMTFGTVAAALVLVVGTGYWTLRKGPHDPPGGPVGTSLKSWPTNGASTPVLGGGIVTFGIQVLTLADGARPVQVTGVRLLDATGMTLVGARLEGPRRRDYQWITKTGFPPKQASKSVAAVVSDIGRARRGWQLLLGVRVSSSGYPRFHAIQVRYRERGQQGVEQQTFPTTFVACVSKAEMVGPRCNDEQDPPG